MSMWTFGDWQYSTEKDFGGPASGFANQCKLVKTLRLFCQVGSRPIGSPFSHVCENGGICSGEAGCINELDHGRFATRQENESHKGCVNGPRALCPGHDQLPVKCIFVYEQWSAEALPDAGGSLGGKVRGKSHTGMEGDICCKLAAFRCSV